MNWIKKLFVWAVIPSLAVVIFLLASKASFSRSLNRDLFPNGRPEYIDCGTVFHEKNVTWILLGQTKSACREWVAEKEWSERAKRVAWRKSSNNPVDPERRFINIILKEHKLNVDNISSIYSGIVDGSDVGYLIILDYPVEGKYYGVACIVRS